MKKLFKLSLLCAVILQSLQISALPLFDNGTDRENWYNLALEYKPLMELYMKSGQNAPDYKIVPNLYNLLKKIQGYAITDFKSGAEYTKKYITDNFGSLHHINTKLEQLKKFAELMSRFKKRRNSLPMSPEQKAKLRSTRKPATYRKNSKVDDFDVLAKYLDEHEQHAPGTKRFIKCFVQNDTLIKEVITQDAWNQLKNQGLQTFEDKRRSGLTIYAVFLKNESVSIVIHKYKQEFLGQDGSFAERDITKDEWDKINLDAHSVSTTTRQNDSGETEITHSVLFSKAKSRESAAVNSSYLNKQTLLLGTGIIATAAAAGVKYAGIDSQTVTDCGRIAGGYADRLWQFANNNINRRYAAYGVLGSLGLIAAYKLYSQVMPQDKKEEKKQ